MSEESFVKAILDEGTLFKGVLSFEGTVRIAGQFEGEIWSEKGTLIIEPSGQVRAQVKVCCLILQGFLKGETEALEYVKMHPPARFAGTVRSPSLQIEEGVVFEGSSVHKKI